jgi:hypothetical protein
MQCVSRPRLQQSIMKTSAKYVSCVYAIKITQKFKLLGIPNTAIFRREIRYVAPQ